MSFRFPDDILFFQAEDGIRDGRVTGVQTCALPISSPTAGMNRVLILAGSGSCGSAAGDRKSVVEGKSGDLGGRRIIKKKKTQNGDREPQDAEGLRVGCEYEARIRAQ